MHRGYCTAVEKIYLTRVQHIHRSCSVDGTARCKWHSAPGKIHRNWAIHIHAQMHAHTRWQSHATECSHSVSGSLQCIAAHTYEPCCIWKAVACSSDKWHHWGLWVQQFQIRFTFRFIPVPCKDCQTQPKIARGPPRF